MRPKRKKRSGFYRSGYCLYAAHQYPCKGEFENGSRVAPRLTLCSCECHGDYEARLIAAGQRMPELAIDDDDEDALHPPLTGD